MYLLGLRLQFSIDLNATSANSQNCRLWWVDDGREVVHASKHAEIGNSKKNHNIQL